MTRIHFFIFVIFGLISGCRDFANFRPEKIPDFKAVNIHRDSVSFSSIQSDITLVVFFTSWCTHCLEEIPLFNSLSENISEAKVHSFQILGINVDQSFETMELFLKKNTVRFPVLHWNYKITQYFGYPNFLPRHFLIDRSGKVKDQWVGVIEKEEILSKIENALEFIRQ